MFREILKAHALQLEESHDRLLQSNLETGSYSKLYSFKHVADGFAVHTTPSQVLQAKSVSTINVNKNKESKSFHCFSY